MIGRTNAITNSGNSNSTTLIDKRLAVLLSDNSSMYTHIPCENYKKIQFQDATYANTLLVRDSISNEELTSVLVPLYTTGWSEEVDISNANSIALHGHSNGQHWLYYRFTE